MKMGQAVASALLFTAGTAGLFAADMYVGDLKQERIENCSRENESNAQKACVETVNDHYNVDGAIDLLEFAGVIAVIGCGYEVYRKLPDERHRSYAAPGSSSASEKIK